MDKRLKTFHEKYPEYENKLLDSLRATEYGVLNANNEIYLDYTGGSLYGAGQLTAHFDLLKSEVYGNPHSDNPSSLRSTALMNDARDTVLKFFMHLPKNIA